MRVLVCGAQGFLGAAICRALAVAGHDVIRGMRHPILPDDLQVDFCTITPALLAPNLRGVEVVVNAVGIIAEHLPGDFEQLHHLGPAALFKACRLAGVRRIVQISALGAETGLTHYFQSKFAGDCALQGAGLEWQIIRPSLVYGPDGASAALFRSLASFPVTVLPGRGEQQLQPIHVADLVAAVLHLAAPETPPGQCLPAVGPDAYALADLLAAYRQGMQLPAAPKLCVPRFLVGWGAYLAEVSGLGLLDRATWKMLQAGNTGDPRPLSGLLGRALRPVARFIAPADAPAARRAAMHVWQLPLLRLTLAFIWIATALVSLFAYPREDSLALLAGTGLTGAVGLLALYGSAGLDFAFGLLSIFRPSRKLWAAQFALVAGYTAIIAFALPEFVWHPFGPLLKNIPILSILFILLAEETS